MVTPTTVSKRKTWPRGPVKLSLELAKKIRSDYITGDYGQRALAVKYNISQSTISRVVRGAAWEGLKEAP